MEIIDRAIFFFTEIYSKLIIKLVVALIIILIGFIVGKIVGKFIYRFMNELNINKFFTKSTGIKLKLDVILSKGVTYIIDFFVIIIAFDAIAFTPTLIYILSGALIIIIVFSIIIGIKDIIPNVVAGLTIYKKGLIKEGEKVEIKDHKGEVEKISLIETIIRKKNKDRIFIPNSSILRNQIIKKSH